MRKKKKSNIPNELIIDADQSPCRFVATDNITRIAQGEKHVSRRGEADKKSNTMTLCESFDIAIPPFQLIYTGKTERSLPNVDFLQGLCFAFNEKHWVNETETVCLINDVLVPYIEKVKEEKALLEAQKNFFVWDAFKAQSTAKVMDRLSKVGIESVMVPKDMTFLPQPLDLSTNAS